MSPVSLRWGHSRAIRTGPTGAATIGQTGVAMPEGLRLISRTSLGLYRIRAAGDGRLLYVGQGSIRHRLRAHLGKVHDRRDPQGRVFGAAERLECSWVVNGSWLEHQRLELENDLIAAHVIATRAVPAAQFLGRSGRTTSP